MRTLTLADLLEEVERHAINPDTVTFTVAGQPVGVDCDEYEVRHELGGVVVAFDPHYESDSDD